MVVGQLGEPEFHRHIYDLLAFVPVEEIHLTDTGSSEVWASLHTKTPFRRMEKGSIVGQNGTDRGWVPSSVGLCPPWLRTEGAAILGTVPAVAPVDTLFPSVTTSRAIFSTGPCVSFPRADKMFQGLQKSVGYTMQRK